MTTVIELYGGPGIGKSTIAASVFAAFKKRNMSCELVQEYSKDWVWIDRKIKRWDQFYILGKQLQKESVLYGKVDYIITDCPLWLISFYEEYNLQKDVCTKTLPIIEKELNQEIKRWRFFLERDGYEYKEKERFHNYNQALEIDDLLKKYLINNDVNFVSCKPTYLDLYKGKNEGSI